MGSAQQYQGSFKNGTAVRGATSASTAGRRRASPRAETAVFQTRL
jgi:hypothetical protein